VNVYEVLGQAKRHPSGCRAASNTVKVATSDKMVASSSPKVATSERKVASQNEDVATHTSITPLKKKMSAEEMAIYILEY